MSVKLILVKSAKPLLAVAAGAGVWYYNRQWDQAADALHLHGKSREEIAKIYRQIDADHDGQLTRKELTEALNKAGHKLSKFNIDQLMKADVNHDGTISEEEFVDAIQHNVNHSVNTAGVSAVAAAEKLRHDEAPKVLKSK